MKVTTYFQPQSTGKLIERITSSAKAHKQVLRETQYSMIEIYNDLNTPYILKTLIGTDRHVRSGFRQLFAREVALFISVGVHPNIVPLADARETSDHRFQLLYHYAPRGDLFDNIAERDDDEKYRTVQLVADEQWAANIVRDVVNGLQALHGAGILHRDIKAENVVLTADGRAQLCDFEFCEWISEPENEPAARNTPASTPRRRNYQREVRVNPQTALSKVTHLVVGTVGCVADEVIQSRVATRENDVFAIGVLLYEILTGDHAFPNATLSQGGRNGSRAPFPRAMSGEARDLIMRLLAKKPSDRPTLIDILKHPFLIN
jgi:serine/threonine protein kinase